MMNNDRVISSIILQAESAEYLAWYLWKQHPGCILWPIEFGYDVLMPTPDGIATCRFEYVVAE